MRALLLIVAVELLPGCEHSSDSDLQALREELEEERKLLRETREELAGLTEELRPLTRMARLFETYDLDSPTGLDLPTGPDPLVPPGPTPAPGDDHADRDRQALLDAIEEGIEKVSDTHYRIDRDVVNKVLDNPTAVSRWARIVPSMKNGTANGFKLYAIRPNSVYARIGLMNGDTIHRINGIAITTPETALEVYSRLRKAKNIMVDLTRRGESMTMRYRIR